MSMYCRLIQSDAYQLQLGRTEIRILRWMMEIKRIEKIRDEEIGERAGVANISEGICKPRLRSLCHVARKYEEYVVMETCKMVEEGEIGRPQIR